MCPCFCNHPIFKASVTHVSECAVNVCRKVFKVDFSRLSVSAVSVPPFNVVKLQPHLHTNIKIQPLNILLCVRLFLVLLMLILLLLQRLFL